jgi:hypothetical protein
VWLEGAALLWLAPLAWYDLRFRAVPHMATIAIPCVLATVYAALTGAWALSALAIVAMATTERYRLRSAALQRVVLGCAMLASAVLVAYGGPAAPGAVAIVGFWMAYELGWWAGADALAAIALALVWPDVRLLVSLAVAHLVLAVCMRWTGRTATGFRWRPRRLDDAELEQLGVPGLPAMVLAVALLAGWHLAATITR